MTNNGEPLSAYTTWDELQEFIEEEISEVFLATMRMLLDETDLTDTERAKALLYLAPTIRTETRKTFEAAWKRLRFEATAPAETFH